MCEYILGWSESRTIRHRIAAAFNFDLNLSFMGSAQKSFKKRFHSHAEESYFAYVDIPLYTFNMSCIVNDVSWSAFTFRHAVAISAVNLKGATLVRFEKYVLNFVLNEKLQASNGVSKEIAPDDIICSFSGVAL